MNDTPEYRLDEAMLDAALPIIYAGRPASEGLPVVRRVAAIAAELCAAAGDTDAAADAAIVNAAARFHLAGPAGAADRASAAASVAVAWLLGAGAPASLADAVSRAILSSADDNGDDPNGRILREAALLDLVSVARHIDRLGEAPAAYRRDCLLPALTIARSGLTLPAAQALYDARLPALAAWLDGQLDGPVDGPVDGRTGDGADTPGAAPVPANWRRLAEVPQIAGGVARLLDGADPAAVRAGMPAGGLPYTEYRNAQRAVIADSHRRILELAHARIEASRNVAAEKYLEGDTIHKPAVEENLFVSARRQARRLGMSPETAEDIARLLLSNARAVQEYTLNDIAHRLSRLHGQVLDAHSPEAAGAEADIAIPSLVVRTGDQPLARENELIKELRVTGLNEGYPRQRRRFLQWFRAPHPYMETGQVIASRDAAPFLHALAAGQPCRVIATLSADGPMHLGHAPLAELLAYFQTLGVGITVGFRSRRPAAPSTRRAMRERLLTLAGAGLGLGSLDAYLQTDRPSIMETALALGDAIPLSVLNSALGLRMRDSATDTFRPLLRLADIIHTQQPRHGGAAPTLVIDGIGGDVYVRMARNVAEGFGFVKPSALYLRMLRSLTTYRDPATGAPVEIMSNAVPQGRIVIGGDGGRAGAWDDGGDDDSDAGIRRRIARAYTGGRATRAEQRQRGGNPDPRICAVSGLHAFFATPEPAEYARLQARCRAGDLLCGECKAAAADGVLEYLRRQRRAQDGLPAATAARANTLAGLPADAD